MTTRTMYDSVNVLAMKQAVPQMQANSIVAYYLDGPRAVSSVGEVKKLFPGHPLNPIDVNGSRANYARTVDCETLDVTPDHLEQWLTDFKNTNPSYETGARGVVYCNRSTIPKVRVGTGRWILGRDYYLWVATGDGTLYTGNGVVACQNRWYMAFDSSVVFSPEFLPS